MRDEPILWYDIADSSMQLDELFWFFNALIFNLNCFFLRKQKNSQREMLGSTGRMRLQARHNMFGQSWLQSVLVSKKLAF